MDTTPGVEAFGCCLVLDFKRNDAGNWLQWTGRLMRKQGTCIKRLLMTHGPVAHCPCCMPHVKCMKAYWGIILFGFRLRWNTLNMYEYVWIHTLVCFKTLVLSMKDCVAHHDVFMVMRNMMPCPPQEEVFLHGLAGHVLSFFLLLQLRELFAWHEKHLWRETCFENGDTARLF